MDLDYLISQGEPSLFHSAIKPVLSLSPPLKCLRTPQSPQPCLCTVVRYIGPGSYLSCLSVYKTALFLLNTSVHPAQSPSFPSHLCVLIVRPFYLRLCPSTPPSMTPVLSPSLILALLDYLGNAAPVCTPSFVTSALPCLFRVRVSHSVRRVTTLFLLNTTVFGLPVFYSHL